MVEDEVTHLLENVDGVCHLSVHDAHLAPHLADVLLHLGGEGVERVRLVGEDGAGDALELGRQVVIHLPARQLDQLGHLYTGTVR